MQLKFFGVAAIAAAVAVPAAAVQPVTITSAGIYNPGYVNATVGGQTKQEFSVPLTFTGTIKNAAFDALGFCVDLPHNIYVGVGSQLAETLHYHIAPLTSDGYGNPLSTGQVKEINGLAHLGFRIATGTAADKATQVAAIQQAIWTVEYPTSAFVATGSFAPAQAAYAAAFVAKAPTLSGWARTIVSDDSPLAQSQITSIGSVPEPAMWVEMLAGFGVVGVLTRRRRGTMVAVAA